MQSGQQDGSCTHWIRQNLTRKKAARLTETLPDTLIYPLGTVNALFYLASQPATWTHLCKNPHYVYPFVDWFNTLWNYSHGVCALLTGFHQCTQGDYKKGLINLLNGSQLIFITHHAVALASCSLAFAMLLDAINATIDYARAYSEYKKQKMLDDGTDDWQDADTLRALSELEITKKNLEFKWISFLGLTAIALPSLMTWLGTTATTVASTAAIANPLGAIAIVAVASYYLFFKPTPEDTKDNRPSALEPGQDRDIDDGDATTPHMIHGQGFHMSKDD